jgi:hypothetical protein
MGISPRFGTSRHAGAADRYRAAILLVCGLLGAGAAGTAGAAQSYRQDAATGIETWETQVAGVTLSLTQILPDQSRAFYVNRGFASAAIESFATACVYMTVLRNDSAPGPVHFRLADWRIRSAAGERPLLSTDEWLRRLGAAQPGQGPLIAFRWAQFPTEQTYQPGGDWNQGMLSTGLPPGARFDLLARWDSNGKTYEGVLEHVRCARENP